MNEEALCCRDLARASRRSSPFDRAIVLGWYDGPTEGLVRCGACNRVYRFEMLDSVDEDRGIRVYSLAPLPADSMDLLVEASLLTQRRRGRCGHRSGSSPRKKTAPLSIEPLTNCCASPAPEIVMTTPGLLDEIGDFKSISASETRDVHDWVSWMGLVRSPAGST